MGVLACERKNCNNIMCDIIIYGRGYKSYYICNRCFEQLEKLKDVSWPNQMTVEEVRNHITEFMESPVEEYEPKENTDCVFQRLVQDRRHRW